MKVTIDLGSVDLTLLTSVELHALGASILTELTKRTAVNSGLVTSEMVDLCREGKRIPAIKLYRERNKVGLKEAKEALDLACPPGNGFPATYT